jgi:hypothetical protein
MLLPHVHKHYFSACLNMKRLYPLRMSFCQSIISSGDITRIG